MHVYESPPPLSAFRNDVTPQIDRVIAKALAKKPEERYQTAGTFSAVFAEAVANIKYYVPTDSEARMQAMTSGRGPKKAKAFLKSTFQASPTSKSSHTIWRFALPLILLFAVIIGSTLSVFFVNKLTHTNYVPATSMIPIPHTDYLADNDAWLVESDMYFFKNGQYHINNITPRVATAFYNSGNNLFSNFRLTITTTEVSGSFDSADFYGIIFRSSTNQNSYYFFEIDTCCGSGQYALLYYNGQSKQKAEWKTLQDGPITSSNLSHTNTITIVAKGSSFEFSVNGKRVGKPIIDHTGDAFLSGEIGLGVEEKNTEVAFSHLQIDKQ